MSRFGALNGLVVGTTTTGTGAYTFGAAEPGWQSLSLLADGVKIPYHCYLAPNHEWGIGTKSGNTLIRTTVLQSTNANSAVNWGAGKKFLIVDILAQNVVKSTDGSVTINDDSADGMTDLSVFDVADLRAWFDDNVSGDVDVEIIPNGGTPTAFAISVLRTSASETNTPLTGETGPFDFTLDWSLGSTRQFRVQGHQRLSWDNFAKGREVLLKLNYAAFEALTPAITWPDDLATPECVIEWVNGYDPALTPVIGSSDSFKFQRLSDDVTIDIDGDPTVVPKYLGWILSTERPVILDGDASSDVTASISTITPGVAKGPDELQWLTATITSDFMDFMLTRTGTVSGGTFDLQVQIGAGSSVVIEDIPFGVTAFDLLALIWANTSLTAGDVNVDGGVAGADWDTQLTDAAAAIHLQFLGAARYQSYTITIDSTNLTGGGSYDVSAIGTGSGSGSWPFGGLATYTSKFMQFSFNGANTPDIAVNASAATIQTAIEALAGIGAGNITVTKYSVGVYGFQFIGDLRATNISYEIQFRAGHLPASDSGSATGQLYSTRRNGAGPLGANEEQQLDITGSPAEGSVLVTLLPGEPEEAAIEIPVTATSAAVQTLVDAAIGAGHVDVAGGPLPGSYLTLTFVGDTWGYRNVPQSTVDDSGAGSEAIDWSICDGKRITLLPGAGEYRLRHIKPTEGETIHVTLTSDGASGTLVWDEVLGVPVDWGTSGAPDIPADGESLYLEFKAESTELILGRIWFGGALLGGLNYRGTWNANSNSPALASGVGTQGHYYIVGTAGVTNLQGITDWKVGDWLIFSSTNVWQKIDNTDLVTSVFGQSGNVLENQFRLNTLTEDLTPNSAADYVMTWDASAGVVKKVLLDNLPGSYNDDDVIEVLTDVLEDGYRLRWDVETDSLGTHFYPDVVMLNEAETYASEITVDLARQNGDRHTFMLAGSPTINVVNYSLGSDPERPGKLFRLVPTQDATGGRTIDWTGSPQTWVFPDGEPALCAIPGAADELEFVVTDVETPTFVFVRAIHRPRRFDDTCAIPATAAISTITEGVSSLNYLNRAFWKMDETSGTRADSVGIYDLTPTGTGNTSGIIGHAVTLTTVDSLLNSSVSSDYPRTSADFTFCCWYQQTADSENDNTFTTLSSATPTYSFVLRHTSGNRFQAIVTGSSTSAVATANTFGAIPSATWCFVAMRWNAATKTLRVSVNAGTSDSNVGFGNYNDSAATGARITFQNEQAETLTLDESGFWSRELSDDNLTYLYNSGSGRTSPFAGGTNEVQRLTFTGTPIKGSVLLTVLGEDVTIPFDATAGEADTLIETAIGAGNIAVTGGPLPASYLTLTFTGNNASTNVAECTVDDTGINGHAQLDWLREVNYITLTPGTYTPTIDLGDVLPSQTIRVAIETDSVTGTPALTGVDFGDEGSPTLPADGKFDLFELTAIDVNTISGRTIQTGLTP